MTQVKLVSLELENFKGIQSKTINFNLENKQISGYHKTGKTTLKDAMCWLFTGNDSTGRGDFALKTVDKNGNVAYPGVDHSVRATLDIDGTQHTVCRIYREQYTRHKGHSKSVLTGHTSKYYIDDVPQNKSKFYKWIQGILKGAPYELLSNPNCFADLHWQTQRGYVITMAGAQLTEEQIIEKMDIEPGDQKWLKEGSISDKRKQLKELKEKCNKELKEIPARVDEAGKKVPDITGIDKSLEEINMETEQLRSQKEEIETKLEKVIKETPHNRLHSVKLEIQTLDSEYENEKEKRRRDVDQDLKDAFEELDKQEHIIQATDIQSKQDYIKQQEQSLQGLRDKWKNENKKTFAEADPCPTCGALPENQSESAQEDFEQNRQAVLHEFDQLGRQIKQRIADTQSEIEKIQADVKQAEEKKSELEKTIEQYQKKLKEIEDEENPNKEKLNELHQERNDLESQIEQTEDHNPEAEKLRGEISTIDNKIQQLRSDKDKLERYEEDQERIEELKQKENELATYFEGYERQLALLETFERTQAEMLSKQINQQFQYVSFQLFTEHINGGIEPTCVPLCGGVPIRSANTAARSQAGLDIINKLSEIFGVSVPVWVDNAESILDYPIQPSQMIWLYVGNEEELTIN